MITDDYEVADGSAMRVDSAPLDARDDPLLVGYKLKPMGDIEPVLAGYFGLHIGDPDEWAAVMKHDGYLTGDGCVYAFDLDAMTNDGIEWWSLGDDPCVMNKGYAPWSGVLFTTIDRVPAKYIKLERIIPWDEIEDYVGEFDESSEDESDYDD